MKSDLVTVLYVVTITTAVLGTASGCTGAVATDGPGSESGHINDSAGGGGMGGASPSQTSELSRSWVRRLSAAELRSSAADVFLGGRDVKAAFSAEAIPHKYDNLGANLSVSSTFAEQLAAYASEVAVVAAAPEKVKGLVGCELSGSNEQACVGTFIEAYGQRIFRRPLSADERTRYQNLFGTIRKDNTASEGIQAVIAAWLQSPNFLFRTELGEHPGVKRTQLNAFETATSLAYLLVRSTPDDELLTAAAAGELRTTTQIQTQAERLISSPRFANTLRDFGMQWLETNRAMDAALDPGAYPEFKGNLPGAMAEEMQRFLEATLGGTGGLKAALTSPQAFVNAPLAALFGVTAPATTALTEVTLPSERAAGFFTHPAFMAAHSPPAGFSPVRPGRFIRERLLCQNMPAPPVDVPSADDPSPSVTSRDRFAKHEQPSCAACHVMLDPVGFGLEQFDALGRRHLTEANRALTGDGKLVGTDVDGDFVGAVGLAKKLVASDDVQRCFVANVLEFALGREMALDADRPSAETRAITQHMGLLSKGSGRPIANLFAAVASSEAFLFRDSTLVPVGGSR